MAEEPKNQEGVLEQEIGELERMLEAKKKSLAEKGEEPEHKEVFREVFKEKYPLAVPEKAPPPAFEKAAPQTAPPSGVGGDVLKKKDDELKKRSREEQLNSLIQLSFEKGVRDAVKIARRETPWILDELHDRLIDEYYQKLIQSKQIKGYPA